MTLGWPISPSALDTLTLTKGTGSEIRSSVSLETALSSLIFPSAPTDFALTSGLISKSASMRCIVALLASSHPRISAAHCLLVSLW